MKLPCEMGVWYVLPSIRACLVTELIEMGLPQKKVARTIYIKDEQLEALKRLSEKTKVPKFQVDMVIEAPLGAHPTSCAPHYVFDAWHIIVSPGFRKENPVHHRAMAPVFGRPIESRPSPLNEFLSAPMMVLPPFVRAKSAFQSGEAVRLLLFEFLAHVEDSCLSFTCSSVSLKSIFDLLQCHRE
jgi:hypothetical protein